MKSGLVSTTPFPHWVICMPKRPDRAKQHWYAQTRVLSDSVHVCMMRSDTRVLSDSVHVYVMRSDTVTVCINKITLGVCPPPPPPPPPSPQENVECSEISFEAILGGKQPPNCHQTK